MFDKTQEVADMCLECGLCMDQCLFLPTVCSSPKELAESMLSRKYVAKTDIPYLCNMCGKCADVCPEELNTGDMLWEIRSNMVEEDIPLPGMIKYVKNQQKFVTSDQFFYAHEAPSGNTKRMFFPGCHLSGYSPDLVASAWKWMNEHDPNCGVLLTCCGAPSYDTGDVAEYERIVAKVKETMAKFGATELVLACTNCAKHFRDCTEGINTKSLYEIMENDWDTPIENAHGKWVLHDPCKSKSFPQTQHAVRALLAKAGYEVVEPAKSGADTRCCGQGGLVAYTDANWAQRLSKIRADEIGGDMVTYCASCRQAMRPFDRPGVHILDLFFTEDIDVAKMTEAKGTADVKASQIRTRELLSK